MTKEDQQDRIHEAAEQFASVIEQVTGLNTRVGVFYNYLDDKEHVWISGSAGNMNSLERIGTLGHLGQMEKDKMKLPEENDQS